MSSGAVHGDQMFVHVAPGVSRDSVLDALADIEPTLSEVWGSCVWPGFEYTIPLGEGSGLVPDSVADGLRRLLPVEVATNEELEGRWVWDPATDTLRPA